MFKINLFRKEDIKDIKENINTIISNSLKKKVNTIDPLLNEFKDVQQIILNFIKQKKRIIYGGYAWNKLILNNNKKDAFYSDYDMPDIDFYSNEPIKDLKELCDIIAEKGYKYIQGKSAQHDESYALFVNFNQYCNITYMSSNMFYGIQYIFTDGFKLIHPRIALIDLLRQYNDPVNSIWRIEKNLSRGNVLIKHYPLEVTNIRNNKKKLLNENSEICKYIFDYCVTNKKQSLVWIDYNVMEMYIKPTKNISNQYVQYNNYDIEIISSSLEKDTKDIYNTLKELWEKNNNFDKFNDDIIVKEFHPFFQFLDKNIKIYHKNTLLITIYGNNEYCIPYNLISIKDNIHKIMIGTFNVCVLYLLIKHLFFNINKEKEQQYEINYQLFLMINTKNKFLTKYKQTIIDHNIYEDFKSECFGKTINPMHKYLLSIVNRKKDRKNIIRSHITTYDPNDVSKNDFNTDNYHFSNSSGNIINNPHELIINNNKIIPNNDNIN